MMKVLIHSYKGNIYPFSKDKNLLNLAESTALSEHILRIKKILSSLHIFFTDWVIYKPRISL